MSEISETIAGGFIASYRDFAEKVHELAGGLSEEQFWTRPYPYGNSFGHLTLHILGNLNHFIGAALAGTDYVREREREFTEQSPPPKAEVLRRLDETIEMVVATLAAQADADWSAAYGATDAADFVRDRFSNFLRCATHFHHHVGQMIYLEKELTKQGAP